MQSDPITIYVVGSVDSIPNGSLVISFPQSMESGNVADSYTVIVGSVYVVFNTNTYTNITKLKLVFATRILSACK